jgi:hypothetical protein
MSEYLLNGMSFESAVYLSINFSDKPAYSIIDSGQRNDMEFIFSPLASEWIVPIQTWQIGSIPSL